MYMILCDYPEFYYNLRHDLINDCLSVDPYDFMHQLSGDGAG